MKIKFIQFRWMIFFLVLFQFRLFAQSSIDTIQLKEILVTTYQDNAIEKTSLNIEPVTIKEIQQSGSFNISDALSKVPGISQLSTGVAISKPVIRGLYGNRILILLSGLRFDNQQWQNEHSLGLSDIGVKSVEVIKGPFSVLYGTEAVGGVINIIEEDKPPAGTEQTDIGIKINSNTLGGTVQAGYKINTGKKWYGIRAGYESNADYSDGNNTRILNSRFDGYYFKTAYGFNKKNWYSENHYDFSRNDFGFIFSDIKDFFDEPDARWSRSLSGPHHIVYLNVFTSQNTLYLKNSELKLNAGLQSNLRMEDEGSGQISLNMHLLTGLYALRWIKQINEKTELILANNTSVENNTNYGSRKIIPDAWMLESGVSAYMKHEINNSIVEAGIGIGNRYIKTLLTPGVNSDEKLISPFTINRPFGNITAGVSLNPQKKINIKLNTSTGVRSPNLAELSSNGLHEGIFTYEIGDPTLKNEQNLNGDISFNYSGTGFQFYVSGYYNHFWNYIYLQPTDDEFFGFPIYLFKQQNANLYGGESELSITPAFAKGWKLEASYSGIIGKTGDGNYLPYIPAQKITPELRYTFNQKKIKDAYIFINDDYVFAQNNIAPQETVTPAYSLLNAGLGFSYKNIVCTIAGNNLLNEVYYDHLSRFKPLGYYNIGRNITVNFKILFNKQVKTK